MLREVVTNANLRGQSCFSDQDLVASMEGLRRQLEEASQQVSTHAANKLPLDHVRAVLAARRRRRQFFDAELFADPAWDILLELYATALSQERISVSKLACVAGVPATTALRWISKLEADGLLKRHDDPLDARRVWVELSEPGLKAMQAYFESCSRGPFPV